jgi:hypothetical protein
MEDLLEKGLLRREGAGHMHARAAPLNGDLPIISEHFHPYVWMGEGRKTLDTN